MGTVGDPVPPQQLHFAGRWLLPLLRGVLQTWAPPARGVVLEVGCGGGAILDAARAAPAIANRCRLVGVDWSAPRCRMARDTVPTAAVVTGDGGCLPVADRSSDLVICDMLIEHVPDDRQLAYELARVIRPGGWLHLSTVASSGRGWYWYRRDGRCVLDPTHVREYPSAAVVTTLLEQAGFTILACEPKPVAYPLTDFILRALLALRLLQPGLSVATLYRRSSILSWLQRLLRIPIPGFTWVEVLACR